DALAAQLDGERSAGEPALAEPCAHEHAGVGGVVDETDLLEPVEDALGDVVGDVLARHRLGELGARARRVVELVERDRASDRLRVGLGVHRGGAGARRLLRGSAAAPAAPRALCPTAATWCTLIGRRGRLPRADDVTW